MNGISVAEVLFSLFPVLQTKLIRPILQQTKTPLSHMQFHVIAILSEKDGYTMTELANQILSSKQQMTPIIDKLISEGLVERKPDNLDRRIVRIHLSASGLAFLESHKKEILLMMNDKFESLAQSDLLILNQSLTDLHRIINKLP